MRQANLLFVVAFALPTLASCGPVQSSQVADQVRGMIGMPQERVVSCMGAPTAKERIGATEVWTYAVSDGVITSAFVSGNQQFAVGAAETSSRYCVINLTFQDGEVINANYHSRGKLLSPSLSCYPVLQPCVPNASAALPAPGTSVADKTKEATEACKELAKDPRLDPLRGVVAFSSLPTLEMQSNPGYVTEEQRAALNVWQPMMQQCRDKIAAANPRLFKILVEVSPAPNAELRELYDRKITIGEYNTRKQDLNERLRAAIARRAGTTPVAAPSTSPQ